MKEKIINYIETLEAKAYQSDDYFKQRNELYISIQEKDKEIERLNSIIKEVREYIKDWQRFPHTNGSTHKELKNLIDILDKEKQ